LPSWYTSLNAKGYTTVSGALTTITISAQVQKNNLLYIIIVVIIIAILGAILAIGRGKKKNVSKK